MSNPPQRALMMASVASMIDQFNMQNIKMLLDKGYSVDVACNCKEGNTISDIRVTDLIHRLADMGVKVIHVPIPRKITDLRGIFSSLKQVRKMCEEKKYSIVHCHSPIGSVIARLGAKKSRIEYSTRVIYTAHGFHFYKGAPKQNWLIFYPIEKYCSHFTDVLITINKEDYALAKSRMNASRVVYIPGVGVDTERFVIPCFNKSLKKKELGMGDDDIMILSVGELNQNKNHEIVIRAISELNNKHIHYYIAGIGNKDAYLTDLAKEKDVNLHLLGYRTDIKELLNVANIFAFSSFREGLSVALMEAMAAGLPCVVSRIRGNVDLIDSDGGYLCDPRDVETFRKGLEELCLDSEKRYKMGRHNQHIMQKFDAKEVAKMMNEIYYGVI